MEAISKLALILLGTALFIQLIKHGKEGPIKWWDAKFLGQVS